MKLSLLVASLATVIGALADEAVIYESPNYRGQSLKYNQQGVVNTPFLYRSFSWTRDAGSACCAGFCKGDKTITVFCSPLSWPEFGPGSDRVIIRCGGPMIDCKKE